MMGPRGPVMMGPGGQMMGHEGMGPGIGSQNPMFIIVCQIMFVFSPHENFAYLVFRRRYGTWRSYGPGRPSTNHDGWSGGPCIYGP